MGIKITPADSSFSKCIRKRAHWRCERCGAAYTPSCTGLHCSHFHGRANWAVRFHPDNASALCMGCHSYFGANPHEHKEFFLTRLGDGMYQILLELKRDTGLAKLYRKTKGKGELSKFYKDQFENMKEGETFDSWA